MNSTRNRFMQNVLFILPAAILLAAAGVCSGQTNGVNHLSVIQMSNPSETLPAQNPAESRQLGPRSQKQRFVDNGDGTITDTKTNLMWIKNGRRIEFVSALTWWDAIQKSREIKVGGHDNWRLPTLEEWSSLIDTSREAPALVASPFENIVTHMPYWTLTEFIYGKDHTCSNVCPFDSYTVILYHGNVGHQKKTGRAFVLPVRSID